MPLPFNKNLDLKLLKLVKDNPILYNPKHSKYLDFDSREVVWQKIGDALSRPAADFAGIQLQVNFGDFQEKKHKPGFLENLQEYLPEQYSSSWGIEKKIFKAYAQHQGLSELDAKLLYIKTARALPTYDVTFFLVKEKQKDKKKLVPRLLGINSEYILRLDEVTKEILQQWPLTHIKTYHAGKSQTFTLNFGEYSDKEYTVKTQDAYRIRDILEDYIDIISKRMLAKPSGNTAEAMIICQDNVQAGQSHLIEHVAQNPSKIVTETFVGPSRILPFDQGSQAQQGTQIMTVQQIVVTDHLQNQQQALKGEVPVRGDMSMDCVRKLNRLNSNSVKIVTLLTDPTDVNVKDAQRIVENMLEDLPVVEKGVKQTAQKQTNSDAKKMLLDELQDLNNYMSQLAATTKPGHLNPEKAKLAAESVADLTTQMYFSIDPKTKRRSDLLRRSRKSFRADEKTEQTIRRASFIAAATTALHSVDTASHGIYEDYKGPKVDDTQRKNLEKALADRMGKLNAALALYLTAHSDPNNVDYAAAINSMNDINELMPELARDAQILASTKDPASRKEFLDDMRILFNATKKVCGMTGNEDHEKMQEASNNYADIAGKLIFTFSRGTNADTENEIIDLAKDAGDKTSLLLVTANELTCQASSEPAAGALDDAGVRTAGAARDLLACAQLTAPAIHEPHCQSALTAAAEALSSSVHQMETTWRPLVEDPTRQHMGDQLKGRAVDVNKALERLKDAYARLGDSADDASLPLRERQRLMFINTMAGTKNNLQVAEDLWNKSATNNPSEQEKTQAQRRLEQQIAQLNAAVAAVAAATADRENPDYTTAELAMSTISELMPQIVKDTEVLCSGKDEATRSDMLKQLQALCDASRDMCERAANLDGQDEAATNFAKASRKLVFFISPNADKDKEKQIKDLSSSACNDASDLLLQVNQLKQHVDPRAASELDARAQRLSEAIQALNNVAQVTAPSINEARCQNALASAVEKLRNCASDLTASCQPHLQQRPELQQQVDNINQQLNNSLNRLGYACQKAESKLSPDISVTSELSPAQQEKQRLKFINSMSGAKNRLYDAEQQLNQPIACQMMNEENAEALQLSLSQRLAQLNAAVAALAAATADREHIDSAAADRAASAMSELMPQIVRDSRKLCGTKTDGDQAAMLENLRILCEATREICDSAGQPQGLGDAAAKFSAGSSKLVFILSPNADNARENQVIDLSGATCEKASELLAQVQLLTEQVKDPDAAAELDTRGAKTADAAQTLLTIAQVTSPSISEPHCSAALISAAERLRNSAGDLTSSCRPHLQQRPELQRRVHDTQQQLDDSINKLVQACQAAQRDKMVADSHVTQERQRLKFINSVSGAKQRLHAVEQQLKQPTLCQMMSQEDGASLERRLCNRLAQLNAGVAALAAATADRENPDYAAANRAVEMISELMPQVLQDSRALCGTKNDADQAAMLQNIKELCEASREVCDSSIQPQGISDVAAKFSAASGKLRFLVGPKVHDTQEKQVVNLSAAAYSKASELLSQVHTLTEKVQDPAAAANLNTRGARTADAAQALLTVAQVTSPHISESVCATALVLAADKLRESASELTASCRPHLQQHPELQQPVHSTQQQLDDSLNRLIQVCCQDGQRDNFDEASPAQREKQRLIFVNTLSSAKTHLDATEQLLNEPMGQMMKAEDGAALQHKLAQRLAQLNAAVAALAAATADRENPDYGAADRALRTISDIMPHVVQDSRKLCSAKDDAGQAATLKDLKALCDSTREICDNAGNPQGLSDAAAKFSGASSKLMFLIGPKPDDTQEKQVMNLSASACGRASELLSPVNSLTEKVQDPVEAADLDIRGAKTADAAQALLTVAQLSAPYVSEPICASALMSAAEKLRDSAADLTTACHPHLQQRPELQQQVLAARKHLDDSLTKLIHACQTAQQGTEVALSLQQEKQRLKFINTVAGVKKNVDEAVKLLKEPVICQMMTQEDGAKLQHQLSRRLAELNVAVAALANATCDGKNPDYPAAERAVTTVTELMPQVIQDTYTLCGTKDYAEQAAMIENLKALCDASREICNNAGQLKTLHEASAKLADASQKLVFIVSPAQIAGENTNKQGQRPPAPAKKPAVPVRDQKVTVTITEQKPAVPVHDKKPAVPQRAPKPGVPVRDPKTHTIAHAVPLNRKSAEVTQDFLHRLRCEETGVQDNKVKVVSVDSKSPHATDDEKCIYKQYSQVIDNVEKEMNTAIDGVNVLNNAKSISMPGLGNSAVVVAEREQHMEDTLARAGVQVASLVAANYADKLDYKAAMEPTIELTTSVKSVVNDGNVVSSILREDTRKHFLEDMKGLCEATKNICQAAKSNKEKLNDAAIVFGDKSAKLLRVVSSDINPTLEKELISRARAIGDTASRLALEASNVASSTSKEGNSHVQDICTAGANCVDAAGKLVYTAKLVAPTIHHATCQDAVVASADGLSSSLTTFSNTWKPLTSAKQPNVQKLTEEAGNLELLVEKLRTDIRAGKLGKRRQTNRSINVDSPLRQMTMEVIDNAKTMAEHADLKPEMKKEYIEYSKRLTEALQEVDLANARYQRAPNDRHKRKQMEIAIQDLQLMLLQSRPSRSGQEINNIVDFRDFLQDLVKEANQLQETATRYQGPVGKRATDDIKLLCSKISEDASQCHGDGMSEMSVVGDILDIDQFGQECDILVKEINTIIQGIQDQKAKQALRAKALPLKESCYLLRFATNCHILANKTAEFENTMKDLDHFQENVMKPFVIDVRKKNKEPSLKSRALQRKANVELVVAASRAAYGQPQLLTRAVVNYAATQTFDPTKVEHHSIKERLYDLSNAVCAVTNDYHLKHSNWDKTDGSSALQKCKDLVLEIIEPELQVLNAEDIDKLLVSQRVPVEGTPKQLQDKVSQLSSKLSSMVGTIVLSVKKPESLSRSLHAAADTAVQLASTARALKDNKKPVQCMMIDDAAHDMCLATYSLLKTSEFVCEDPNHHDSRRKLLEACGRLNESINKLNRSVNPTEKLRQECSEALCSLQLQRSVLQATPQPFGALPYAHCVDKLYSQRDVLQKLNSNQTMSREEFLKSLHFITGAVNNSSECAAQATYLLSVSEEDESIGKEGIVDVCKLHKTVAAVLDTCSAIAMARHEEQVQEEKRVLESQVRELLESLEESSHKKISPVLKMMLEVCKKDVDFSAKHFYNVVNENKPKDEIISSVVCLMDDVNCVASLLEDDNLVPTVGEVSADTKAKCDDIVKNSLSLLSNTEELIKQVKSSPEQPEVMTWVMFNKRKDVLDAFDALLKSIKSNGQKAGLLEGSAEDSEEQKKTYVQKQFETASKWLSKPTSNAEVKSNGQQAVRNLIDMANKVTEDLKGNDQEDMRHLIMETEQLLTECSKKYDHEQYSVLLERARELKKGIERGVVTRVVEDFMDAEEPLADFDILADAERDETKRKFLLEKKIAELLAHLSRVTKTARLIAETDADTKDGVSTQLNTCSQQAELLAPMLVKAAQQRVATPDDEVVIENYRNLLARYAESLSKIRDLCDQSVDPMDFVQTAGETMQRMREESTKHNDPMKCAQTSAAITKLANRVIHVGMSSSAVRDDPELHAALTHAQQQLSAATPAPDTRRSRMPDWKDTTAKILQATEEVESLLGGETIFKKQPEPNQPIYNEALNLHVAIRDWSSRDNEIVAVAKRMAVLMAKLSNFMNNDKQRSVLATSKAIVAESHEVARLARKLAHECSDHRIQNNLLQACERIPTISGQLKMLTTVKGFSLGRHGTQEDKEAMDMLVGNAQSLMLSIQDVVKGAASASVKIMSQRGLRMKWVRKHTY